LTAGAARHALHDDLADLFPLSLLFNSFS